MTMLIAALYYLIAFFLLFQNRLVKVAGINTNLQHFTKDDIILKVWHNDYYSTNLFSEDKIIYLTLSSPYGLKLQVLTIVIFSKMHGGDKVSHKILECGPTGLIGDIGIKLEIQSGRKSDKIEIHTIVLLCENYCSKICEKSLPHTWSKNNIRHIISEPMKLYHVSKMKRNVKTEYEENEPETIETLNGTSNTTTNSIEDYIHVHWSMVLLCSIIFIGLLILVISLLVFMWSVKRATRLREDFMPLIQNESQSPINVSDESDHN